MKVPMIYAVILWTVALLVQVISAFRPISSTSWTNRHCLQSTSSRRYMSTTSPTPKTTDTSSSSDDDDTIMNAQEAAAIESLQKLLKRQQEEMQETLHLLKRLKQQQQQQPQQHSNHNDLNVDDDHNDHRLQSIASSFLSGVDYGFVSRSEGAKFQELTSAQTKSAAAAAATTTLAANENTNNHNHNNLYYGPPANLLRLGSQQFIRNWNAMKGEYRDEPDLTLTPQQEQLQAALETLTLNATAIWEREKQQHTITNNNDAPFLIQIPYNVLCYMLDVVFEGKYVFGRFFLLETVARMPYFSYITMLHLYETLGFWRRSADMKRIHFAEELNEFRHLLIMESLGGDQEWFVRFLAQHSAIAYYIVLCLLWAVSPTLSYKFSEMLETHAVHTYGQFLDENKEKLQQLPPTMAAVEYYTLGASDPFYAEIQTNSIHKNSNSLRRPGTNMTSLFNVFQAIQADEADHVSTMQACLDPDAAVRSVSMEQRILIGMALAAAVGVALGGSGGGGEIVATTEDAALAETAMVGGAAFLENLMSSSGGSDEATAQSAWRELEELGIVGIGFEGLRRFFAAIVEFFLGIFAGML